MTGRPWLRKLFARPARPARKAPARRRPSLEALEDRVVPSTFTVSNANDSGAGSLRQAILDANASAGADVITFDPTAFSTPQTIRLHSSLPDVTGDLTVSGPGAGRLTVSGDANGDGVNDPGDVRILSVSAGTVTLSGLTLAGGRAQGADGGPHSPAGTGQGGALYVAGGAVTLAGVALTGNVAQGGHGNETGGSLVNGGGAQGGAVYVGGGTVTLTGAALTGNTAQGGDGGDNSEPQVQSWGGRAQGGAIYVAAGGAAVVTNSTLSGNTAQGGRGGDLSSDPSGETFSRGGDGVGGGIYVFGGGTATLSSSTLSGNAAWGGAPGQAITSVNGLGVGGGLYQYVGGSVGITNTIVAGNQSSIDPDVSGAVASGGYNLIGAVDYSSGWVGTDRTGTFAAPLDPRLAPLGDYGGPTQTLALLPGSPALDAGDPAFATPGATDQRGLPRVAGGRLDVGAFESRGFTLAAAPGSTPQRAEVGTPFATALAVTLTSNDPGVPVPDGTAVSFSVAPAAGGAAATLSAAAAATSGGQASVSATANAFPGSYAVTASAAGAGPVTFDLDNYAVPTVAVNPVSLVYGTALADGQLSGTATAVVNGQAVSVPGTFFYGTAGQRTAGTVLGAGDHDQRFTFVPDDPASYASVGSSVAVHVDKATPSITWADPAAIVYGTPLSDAQLDARAGWTVGGSPVAVAGTFSYDPAAGTVLGAGSHTLTGTFTPADTADYTSATAGVTLTVTPATPTLTWADPADIVYGTPLGADQLDATADVPGTFSYSPAPGAVLGVGTHALSASFTPADTTNYTGAAAGATLAVLSADDRFVRALYRDALGRDGSPAERAGWVAWLGAPGGSRAGVAAGVEGSAEAHTWLVDRWYRTYLGRAPQGGEGQGWVGLLRAGQGEGQVLGQFLASPELAGHAEALGLAGPADAQFVRALYQLLLDRDGSDAEVAGWVSALPVLGRRGVALDFLQSAEYRADVAGGYYAGLLHRPGSAAEVDAWASSGLDLASIRIGIESSDEFHANG